MLANFVRKLVSDHGHFFLFEEGPITYGALRNAPALEFLFTGNAELLRLAAGGQDHEVGEERAVIGLDDFLAALAPDRGDVGRLQLDAKLDRLVGHPLGKFRPGDMVEAWIVLDRLGVEQLPAWRSALQQHGLDPSPPGVQGGRQSRRTTANDGDVVLVMVFHCLRGSHVIQGLSIRKYSQLQPSSITAEWLECG